MGRHCQLVNDTELPTSLGQLYYSTLLGYYVCVVGNAPLVLLVNAAQAIPEVVHLLLFRHCFVPYCFISLVCSLLLNQLGCLFL